MLEEVIITKMADVIFEKYRKLQEERERKVSLVEFPTTSISHTELDDATTDKKEFDKDHPDLSFENPYKKTCLVKEISLIPDDTFKSNGRVEIYIGEELVFRNKKFGNFKNISQSEIILGRGKSIKPNESVNVFLESGNGSVVGLAVQVTFGN